MGPGGSVDLIRVQVVIYAVCVSPPRKRVWMERRYED